MNFSDYLQQMPDVGHLCGLDVCQADGEVIHHIPAVDGKLGSLKLYHALYQQFNGLLDKKAAEQGLIWFAEHLVDAQAHPTKHPNIDLLLRVKNESLSLLIKPLNKG